MKKIDPKLILQDDGLYVIVATDDGEDSIKAVKELLFSEGYVNVNYSMVERAVQEHSGEPVKISDTISKFDKDDNIIVHVSENEMEAYVTLIPPEGAVGVTEQEIEYKLKFSGVVHGIDTEMIGKIANRQGIIKNILVATGSLPENGQDAYINYLFDTEQSVAPIILEDGNVDFYQLNLVKCIEEGVQLAEKVPPTLGRNGCSVTGKTVPAAPGKDVVLKGGSNTQLDPTGTKLFAKMGGRVFLHNNQVCVESIYIVKGDVDFSTGNINFLGEVIVKGDVRTGFEVHAGGDINIKGSVEGANVISKHGNINIGGSVQGENRASLTAAKDVRAKFVTNCKIKAEGNVEIAKYIAHSEVEAGGVVEVLQGRGAIFGGRIKAGDRISVISLGNESGTRTSVCIEDFLTAELQERLCLLNEELEKAEKELDIANKAKQEVARLGANVDKLFPSHKDRLLNAVKKLPEIIETCDRVKLEKTELLARLKPRDKAGRIEVKGTVFPNAEICFGNVVFEVRRKNKGVTFVSTGNDIKQIQN